MRLWARLRHLYRNAFQRNRLETDLDDELRNYVDALIARKTASEKTSESPGLWKSIIPVELSCCVSIFQACTLTLGQMADACVYVGGDAAVDTKAKPVR
jgi:hypothetical protein